MVSSKKTAKKKSPSSKVTVKKTTSKTKKDSRSKNDSPSDLLKAVTDSTGTVVMSPVEPQAPATDSSVTATKVSPTLDKVTGVLSMVSEDK